jgi:hypothetical protein
MIENPQTGLLKDQWFMGNIPYNDLDYCKYGMPYRKRTRIWNNIYRWTPKPLCQKDCDSMNGNKHEEVAQRGKSGPKETWENQKTHKQRELYVIPELLLIEFFCCICFNPPPTVNNSLVFFSEVIL